jgi:hypothetical protein
MNNNVGTRTILILTANPKNTSRLRLDEEVREIDTGLRLAEYREQFNLVQRWSVRPRDVSRAMLSTEPQIVHFSGHGGGEEGLILEDEEGQAKSVSTDALADLFKLFADKIECVVLNGCYTEVQAKAIAQHIPYVIGMNKEIGDRAAIVFAVGFYDSLGAGRDVEFAYSIGCNAIQVEGIPEHLTPVLIAKPNNKANETIQVNIESVQSGHVYSLAVNPRSSIRELSKKCIAHFQFNDSVNTGGSVNFKVRWALIDVNAENVWKKTPRPQQAKIYTIVNSCNSEKISYSPDTSLKDAGIYENIVLHMYSIEDYEIEDCGDGEFSESRRSCADSAGGWSTVEYSTEVRSSPALEDLLKAMEDYEGRRFNQSRRSYADSAGERSSPTLKDLLKAIVQRVLKIVKRIFR